MFAKHIRRKAARVQSSYSLLFMKEEQKRPPCPCYYCGEWIEDIDYYRIDFLGRLMCLDCYDWIHQDLFDKPD